jgi:ribosome recycling factor
MEEELEMTLLEAEERMDKAITAYEHELSTVRTGRASPSLLDTVYFEYYGAKTQIKNAASITVPESNQLLIKPYDKSSVKDIEKAILASPLGLTPQSDGTVIRLILPMMTEERRRELVKIVSKMEEQAKVAVRNVRRDLNDDIKKIGLPEDTEKNSLEDAQKLTDNKIAKIGELTQNKQKELMTL